MNGAGRAVGQVIELPIGPRARGRATAAPSPQSRTSRVPSAVAGKVASTISGVVSGTVAAVTGTAARLADRSAGMVDDWGRDPALVQAVTLASQLRWSTTVGGEQRLPARKGALIIVNTRRYALAPVLAALAIGRAVDRPVRFVGRPDVAPVGAIARRVGALLDDPEELRGALRAGELVVLGAAPSPTPRGVGIIDHFHVGAAVSAGVPIFPAATTSTPLTRLARVEIGDSVRSRHRRRGPLGELELADQIAVEISLLLAGLGDLNSGWPFDRFPFGGVGGN